jgi:uncharacterized membrane protein (UPF0127 family)
MEMEAPVTRRILVTLACGLAALLGSVPAGAQDAPQTLPTTKLSAGIHVVNAMVADRPDTRQTGLMHRREMAPNDGMLFVFERAGEQCFWMKNTLIPLSIAFLADDGRIVNVESMKPQTLDGHCSKEPVRYALEMNAGWFAQKGLKAGAKVRGLPAAPPAR